MRRLSLQSKFLKRQIIVPAVILLLSPTLASCLKSSLPTDARRDQMIDTSYKVTKVLSKQLNLSKDRIMLNLRLDQIGVAQNNKLKLQSALEKELKMKIPYKVLDEKNTVGSIIRYVAIQKNTEIQLKPHSSVKFLSPPEKLDSNTKVKSEDEKSKNTKNTTSQNQTSKATEQKSKSEKPN